MTISVNGNLVEGATSTKDIDLTTEHARELVETWHDAVANDITPIRDDLAGFDLVAITEKRIVVTSGDMSTIITVDPDTFYNAVIDAIDMGATWERTTYEDEVSFRSDTKTLRICMREGALFKTTLNDEDIRVISNMLKWGYTMGTARLTSDGKFVGVNHVGDNALLSIRDNLLTETMNDAFVVLTDYQAEELWATLTK